VTRTCLEGNYAVNVSVSKHSPRTCSYPKNYCCCSEGLQAVVSVSVKKSECGDV
jgi:hypothetical protein